MSNRFAFTIPAAPPTQAGNLLQDAEILRLATKGFGTDMTAIVNVTTNRSREQRIDINLMYMMLYGKSLEGSIEGDTSFHAGHILHSLYRDYYDYLYEAVFSHASIPAILFLTDEDKQKLEQKWWSRLSQQQQLLENVPPENKLHLKGFQAQLVGACRRHADSDGHLLTAWTISNQRLEWQPEAAADELIAAAKRVPTDQSVFVKYLCNTKPENYRLIAAAFEQKHKKSLEATIYKEFHQPTLYAVITAHLIMMNPQTAIAGSLYYTMKGAGTNDDALIYLTCAYGQALAPHIRQMYQAWGDPASDIKGDLKGRYQQIVLGMWGLLK